MSEQDDFPERFHRDRREHGGASKYIDDDQDEQLARLTEEERVAAGLDAYDPDEVPPGTDTPPQPEDITQNEDWQEERAEFRREEDKGELGHINEPHPFPPTRYDGPSAAAARRQGHAGLGGVDEERQRLLEVQLHGADVVREVADRQILAEAQ